MNSRFIVLIALSWPSQIGTAVRIRMGEGISSKANNKSGIQENRKTDEMSIPRSCFSDWCPQIWKPDRRFASVAAQITDLHQLGPLSHDCFLLLPNFRLS